MKTIIDCLLFRGETVNPIPLEDVSEHIGDADNFIWIELASPDSRTITQLGDEFGLHELALEDAISIHQRTKLEEYGGHLFIAARTASRLSSSFFRWGFNGKTLHATGSA